MDPIILTGIVIVLIILFLRIFFGMAKLLLKIGVIILVAIVIWRVFFAGA
jgi:hypothetical protein